MNSGRGACVVADLLTWLPIFGARLVIALPQKMFDENRDSSPADGSARLGRARRHGALKALMAC
jgi:hypothetical protein